MATVRHLEHEQAELTAPSSKRSRLSEETVADVGVGAGASGSMDVSESGTIILSEEERLEADRMARIAERAEQKAMMKQQQQHQQQPQQQQSKSGESKKTGATFLTKAEREQLALEKLYKSREEKASKTRESEVAHSRFVTGQTLEERKLEERKRLEQEELARERRQREENKEAKELDHETKAIRDHYLGIQEKKKKALKPSEKFARVFQFEWEDDDDTGRTDVNPLYNNRTKVNALFGRGYIAGIDQRDQRKGSNFILSLTEKRLSEKASEEDQNRVLTDKEKLERTKTRDQMMEALKKRHEAIDDERHSSAVNSSHWSSKSLEKMTERDWRIFREDFDIRIQGGRATLPLRYWAEAKFPDPVLHAIKDAGYENPSPIQRQAIPVGLAHRDMIGIAETGSGKTAAFAIPLLCFLANSPEERLRRCADEGPLAIVMAPTRELAQQIYEECCKLAKHTNFSACCVVGGQSIEQQGFRLRQGVHIVIGTPGRLCDCLQNNYLVLNQCSYVVLDEADRMVDMGFEPQVVEVLDAMGGLLKSEDEDQAEQQIQGSTSNYRVTAMVSLICIFDFVSVRSNSCWLCV
jgi:ATP-dependent RNA helicase DDX23/PRP28